MPVHPVVFVGHGSPMNAIEDSAFRREWQRLGRELPRPRAILCVSAHWETRGTRVTAMTAPETIHDFGGFPDELFAVQYPAPGDPVLAARVRDLIVASGRPAETTTDWGLDHGAWSVLVAMYPDASIPVVQLSLDRGLAPAGHFALARSLNALRDEGVLLLGSGNLVHNLRRMDWALTDGGYDWAERFDRAVAGRIDAGADATLADLAAIDPDHANDGPLAVPTWEHYLPLLYVLAQRRAGDSVSYFNDRCVMGSISMRGFVLAERRA